MVAKTLKRGLILSAAVPVAAAGARKLSQKMEASRGSSKGSRLLRKGADMLQRRKKSRRFW